MPQLVEKTFLGQLAVFLEKCFQLVGQRGFSARSARNHVERSSSVRASASSRRGLRPAIYQG